MNGAEWMILYVVVGLVVFGVWDFTYWILGKQTMSQRVMELYHRRRINKILIWAFVLLWIAIGIWLPFHWDLI